MEPALALANADAVHPVRRLCPVSVPRVARRFSRDDIRFFAMSYAMGFIAVYTFIA